MNVIEIQERLKDLSDAQLQQVAQTPGMAPEFLVMNELNRRQRVREDYQASMAQNPSTVKQDLMSAPGIPSAAGAQMAQAMRPEGAQTRAGLEGAVPMAEGGIVAGLKNDPLAEYSEYDAFMAKYGEPSAVDPSGFPTPLPQPKPAGIGDSWRYPDPNETGVVPNYPMSLDLSEVPTPLPQPKPAIVAQGRSTRENPSWYANMGRPGQSESIPLTQGQEIYREATQSPGQLFYRRLMRLFGLGD